LIIKELGIRDLRRIREIDRSEKVKLLYKYDKNSLTFERVDLNVPRWN